MTYKSQLGKLGENLACEYLVKKGYKIIDCNFRQKWGELDIISKAPDRTLVFVEVKTMTGSGGNGLQPEDQLTKAKLQKLKRTASLYAGHNSKLIKDDKGWQIDLIALTIDGENCDIRHYENVNQ
ncbi:YraN family protein [Candidatus Wolfebacteria bacterium]|nr:YraN family protein [Candidatus Wolfebacteria bacterium]